MEEFSEKRKLTREEKETEIEVTARFRISLAKFASMLCKAANWDGKCTPKIRNPFLKRVEGTDDWTNSIITVENLKKDNLIPIILAICVKYLTLPEITVLLAELERIESYGTLEIKDRMDKKNKEEEHPTNKDVDDMLNQIFNKK